MQSFLRYPGGKSRRSIQRLILAHAPQAYGEYREPFCGGAGIFFAVPPSKQRWLNDMNTHLIAVYLALRDRPWEFIELCQSIAPAHPGEPMAVSPGGTLYPQRLFELFYLLRDNHNADLALRYFFINRTSYAGRVVLNGDRVNRTTFSNPKGWSARAIDRLADAAELLRGVQVTCGDFEQVIMAPGREVWNYVDAPYMRDTELPKSGKLYQFGFTLDDHRRLADIVKRCPHHVCLSYDDHPFIRELYQQFFIHEAKWTYCGTSLKTKTQGRELLITNYPVQCGCSCVSAPQVKLDGISNSRDTELVSEPFADVAVVNT